MVAIAVTKLASNTNLLLVRWLMVLWLGCDTLVILPSLSRTGLTRIASKKVAASPSSQLNRDLFLESGVVLRLYGHPLRSCSTKKSPNPMKLFLVLKHFDYYTSWEPVFSANGFLNSTISALDLSLVIVNPISGFCCE